MSRRFALLCALVLVPCAAGPAGAQHFQAHEKGALARIVFTDSLVSYNDRCPITKSPLSLEIEPVYVNLRPVAFCCSPCPPARSPSAEPTSAKPSATPGSPPPRR